MSKREEECRMNGECLISNNNENKEAEDLDKNPRQTEQKHPLVNINNIYF